MYSLRSFEPKHDKTSKMICAPSEYSDQPGHPSSLTRVFAVHSVGSYKDPRFLHADSDDSDQIGRMPRFICIFTGCTGHFVGFAMQQLIVTKWIKLCLLPCFGTFQMPFLIFISILVFRPEGQIWNPVRRDTKTYVRRILNASRISKNQLNSNTISPS